MKFLKLSVIFLLLFNLQIFSQSFTYSGPTSGTSPLYYTFSYSNTSGLVYPTLIIAVDNQVITSDLCHTPQGGWLPSSYNIPVPAGSHTITLSLLSINPDFLDCYIPIIHQQVEINVNIAAVITADNNFTIAGGSHGSIKIDGTTYTAPKTFSRFSGSNVTLQAISPQTNSQGYQMTWNTGSCEKSKWTRNGQLKSYSQSYSFTVASNDHGQTYLANFYVNHATTNGTLTSNESWISNVSLAGNVFVPSGKTLTLTSCATVNLNGKSIISTGGTIVRQTGSTINGLRARLTANLVPKGYCGTIQAAATYAGSTNEIYLENGNFNENVSISNKYSLSIFGNQQYTHFGNLTVTNCNLFHGAGFGAKSVYFNYASYLSLIDLNVNGINQSTIGFSLYNSDTYNVNNLTAVNSQTGMLCSDGTDAGIDESWLGNNLNGLRSYNGSNVSIYNSFFCGTGLDLKTYNFSSIHSYNSHFDGGVPSTSGSNIYHTGDQGCSLSKTVYDQTVENNKDNNESSEFEKINSAYFSINKKLSNAFKEKASFNKEALCTDYEKITEDFKEFINNNPDSPLANIALVASAKSYRRINELNEKSDFIDMKNFLESVLEKKEYTALKQQAERLMIEYYRLAGNFTEAIKTADDLIENYKDDPDYVSGVLYAKGLMLAYDLNQPNKAAESFSLIKQRYPENSLAALAENELRIIGEEAGEQIEEAEIVSTEIELSSYPNPFNPVTTINYTLPVDEKIIIKVYDILGREVTELVNEFKTAGKYSINFNASNLSSGVYFYSIRAGNFYQVKKMILTK